MKAVIFNQYVNKVSGIFGLTPQDIFVKTKKRDIVDARQLLWYLCIKRPMRLTYIQKYMKENGYDVAHSSILHGIDQVERKVELDSDYQEIIDSIR